MIVGGARAEICKMKIFIRIYKSVCTYTVQSENVK